MFALETSLGMLSTSARRHPPAFTKLSFPGFPSQTSLIVVRRRVPGIGRGWIGFACMLTLKSVVSSFVIRVEDSIVNPLSRPNPVTGIVLPVESLQSKPFPVRGPSETPQETDSERKAPQ
jgi:hypothetical protein